LAQQTEPVKRTVAVKVIKAGMDSKAVLARFEAERQALALMDHPSIAKVLDASTTAGGRPFFVMELVKGVPITQFCDERQLTPRQRLELFVPVCQAIQHAHQKGIIHRDIKPSNVLVALYDDRAVPKVIDFGVAKATGQTLTDKTLLTGFGAVVGTPEYMSPEQANLNNLDIDTRSDVYSLGVLLYELLTGSTPMDRKSLGKAALLEILRIVREVEVPKPSARLSSSDTLPSVAANRGTEPAKLSKLLKGELDWLVLKALEKDRSRRYESANGLARDIQRYLADEVVEARPPSTSYRLQKFVRRHKGQVIAASFVLLALVAGFVGTSLGLLEARRQAENARAEAAAKEMARAAEAAQREVAEAKQREATDEKGKALAAAEQERQAKLEADAKRKEAERNLAFAKKGNDILGSVFAGLDPKARYATVAELRNALRDNLAQAVKELEGSAVGDPVEVAAMQNTLGLSLLGLGEWGLAVAVLKKARDTRAAQLGPDHSDTLVSMNNLAEGYRAAGKLDQALPLYEQTLALMKVKRGPDHPDTLSSMNNLALGYQAAGQLDQALPLFEQTMALRKAKLGPDHPHTLASMNNLAEEYRAAGKLDQALPLFEETLALRKAKLGPDHPHTLSSMGNLAVRYQAVGKLDKALTLLEQTLALRKAKLGPDHPDTLISMGNLAATYWSLKRLDKSVPLFEELLPLQAKKLGRGHPDTLLTVANLGVNYKDAGRLKEALPLLEEAYRASKQHATLRWVGSPLLDAYLKAGKTVAAGQFLDQLLADARQQLPKDSPQLAGLLAQLGLALLKQEKWAEAEPFLRECLALRAKTQPDDWTTFHTQSLLGGALLGQQKYADAEPLLLQGYEGMKQREKTIPPQGGTRIPEALDRLIELYTATNRPDQVTKWRAERQKYPPPEKK
jgi:hypothetical protein